MRSRQILLTWHGNWYRLRRDFGAKWFNHTTHESSYVFGSTLWCLHLHGGNTLHPYPLRGSYVIQWLDGSRSRTVLAVWRNDTMDFGTCCYYWCLIRLNRFSIHVMCWRGMIVYLVATSDYGLSVSPTVRVDHSIAFSYTSQQSAGSVRCWRAASETESIDRLEDDVSEVQFWPRF
jgi:hypothetical protein